MSILSIHHKVDSVQHRDITTERNNSGRLYKKPQTNWNGRVEERTGSNFGRALSEIKTLKDQLEAENIYFRQEIK